MKKKIYIVALILLATAFFAPAVKAENKAWNQDYSYGPRDNGGYIDHGYANNRNSGPANPTTNCGSTAVNGNPSTPAPSANLPINGGVVFLFVGGITIGIVVLKKQKTLKPALVK